MKKINIFIFIRIVIGGLFIFSGFGKIINPVENFQYVVESYEIFPDVLEVFAAHVVPWVEFLAGIFCILGLWLLGSLRIMMLLFLSFIVLLSQAIIRQLPIMECGCFGESMSFPVPVMLCIDIVMLILTLLMIKRLAQTRQWGLDHIFDDKS